MAEVVALNREQIEALHALCDRHFGDYEPPEDAVVIRQTGSRRFRRGPNRVTVTIYQSWLPVTRYDLNTTYARDDWVPREVPLSRRERFERWRRTRRR